MKASTAMQSAQQWMHWVSALCPHTNGCTGVAALCPSTKSLAHLIQLVDVLPRQHCPRLRLNLAAAAGQAGGGVRGRWTAGQPSQEAGPSQLLQQLPFLQPSTLPLLLVPLPPDGQSSVLLHRWCWGQGPPQESRGAPPSPLRARCNSSSCPTTLRAKSAGACRCFTPLFLPHCGPQPSPPAHLRSSSSSLMASSARSRPCAAMETARSMEVPYFPSKTFLTKQPGLCRDEAPQPPCHAPRLWLQPPHPDLGRAEPAPTLQPQAARDSYRPTVPTPDTALPLPACGTVCLPPAR